MSEQVMGLDKDNNGMSKKSVHVYESAWLGRWTLMGSEAAVPGQSRLSIKEVSKWSKEFSVVSPEIAVGDAAFGGKCRDVLECERGDTEENLKENRGRKHGDEGWDVSPFPMFNVSQQRESIEATRIAHNTLCNAEFKAYPRMETRSSFYEAEGSSSKAMAIRRPLTPSWMHAREENALPAPCFEKKENFSSNYYPNIPVQVKSTEYPPDLIRPMRIFTTVDSVEGTSREPYSLSQTSRPFLLAKKTDLNLSGDSQVFGEPTVSRKLKGKMFSGLLDLFPNADLRHREGVRLHSVGSSRDKEEGLKKIDVVKSSAVCARNESSAETDTLDMDNFQRIRLSGSFLIAGSTSPLSPKGQGRKNQSAFRRVEIPDMNQEPPVVPDKENSGGGHGGDASTSETQSMNVEHCLSNTGLPKECKRLRSDPEPYCTWVKRLKTGAPDFSGHGTKSMTIEEASPGEKVNNFCKIIKCGVTNAKPRNEEPSTSQFKNTQLGGQDITLLHPWIQRWCKNKAAKSDQQAGEEVTRKPGTSNEIALEEIQKKQFPSIQAMALMGKALSGLSPSGLRKSSSLIIWNTPELR